MIKMGPVMVDMIFSGVFDRFPGLHISGIEVGCGWVPHTAEMMDDRYWRNRARIGLKLKHLPSHYVRENFTFSYIVDQTGIQLRHAMGVKSMLWSTDFPHHGNNYPYSRESIDQHFVNVPEAERHAILAGNAVAHVRARVERAASQVKTLQTPAPGVPDAGPPRRRAARWSLAVLVAVNVFNHIDRQIMVILLDPVKQRAGCFGLPDGAPHRPCLRDLLHLRGPADRALGRPRRAARHHRARARGLERHDRALRRGAGLRSAPARAHRGRRRARPAARRPRTR